MMKTYNRRNALMLGGGIAAAGSLAACAAIPGPIADVQPSSPLEFDNPVWNRDKFARLQGNTVAEEQKWGWYGGRVFGIVPDQRDLHICNFEGFSVARLLPLGDGNYRKVLREVGFYLDKDTGEILETFENPYTGERVKVVPIANDPFNLTIEAYYPAPPSYGGLNTEAPPRRPLLLNWREFGDRVLLHTDINLYYPSSLQPEQWPRESPGKMTQVSEFFTYNISKADLMNPELTTIEHMGVWNRTTPWFPWLLMGQAAGHMLYVCDFAGRKTPEGIPQKILDAAAAIDPKYLEAPYEDYGPSLSSLENYKLTQTPAPPRAD